MSAISQKSISGITSITSPAGTDDQISLHTSNTNEALKIDGAGNLHLNNHVNTTGVSTASNFKTGSSNLHNVGIEIAGVNVLGADTPIGAGATIFNSGDIVAKAGAEFQGIVTATSMDVDDFLDVGSNIKLGNAGVITATSFVGDGSDLTNLPAGLGTALSATASSPLNKMYYTNQVLGVPSSVTVDVPASASKAYTQYADIKVESSADLIVAEGDDLIPDILGLADFGTFGGGASAGRIRVNSISNAANDGSPTVQKGLVITGVTTSTSFSGSGANLTSLPAANLTGTLPAISGANLTSLPAANLTGTLPAISGANLTSLPAQATIANNADNRVITGGSGVNLNGESGLTYNGSTLGLSGSLAMTGGSISLDSHSLIATAGFTDISGGSYAARLGSTGSSTIRSTQIYGGGNHIATFDGVNYRLGINETSPDGMLHLKGGVPSIFLEDTDGTHGQAIIEQNGDILKIRQDAGNASSGTGSVIQFEVDGSAWAKVDTAFGLKADNTCKAWLVYRSEAGNEGIIDDFNVATVNDETTGTFGVNLEVNVHRHGNGFSQSIVFGSYNASSYPFVASVGYAPSHGSNNPWWDVEDNFVRVQTQRSDTGAILDAKVFSLAMFGDTGDLNPA